MAYVSKTGKLAAFGVNGKVNAKGDALYSWTLLGEAEDTIELQHGTVLFKGTDRNIADKGAAKDQRFRIFPVLVPTKWTVNGMRDLLTELVDNRVGMLATMLLDSLYQGIPLRFDDDVWVDVIFGKVSAAKVMEYATTDTECLKLMLAGRRDEALAQARATLEDNRGVASSDKDVDHDTKKAADASYKQHCS